MSLDVDLICETPEESCVWTGNITHNLGKMAGEIGMYYYLWRPEEVGIKRAEQMTRLLQLGLCYARWNKVNLLAYQPSNGWGSVNTLIEFMQNYLEACQRHPKAIVKACR